MMEMDRRVACVAAVMLFNSLRGVRMTSRKRQRRLQLVAALLYEQEGSGMYMQLNPNIPILKVYNDPESCLKRDLRLTRQLVNFLLRIIHSLSDHGLGQELEVLMFLYSLAHGLSLSGFSTLPLGSPGPLCT
ncbi:hypothetical protein INR49_017789, partial [Caranx melampygus]